MYKRQAGLFATDFGVGWVFVANLIASVVTWLAILGTADRTVPKINWALLAAIFAYSLPLLVGGLAGTANEFIDRQLIKYLVPEEMCIRDSLRSLPPKPRHCRLHRQLRRKRPGTYAGRLGGRRGAGHAFLVREPGLRVDRKRLQQHLGGQGRAQHHPCLLYTSRCV